MSDEPRRRTCPSVPAEENAILLAAVAGGGSLAYITPQLPVSREFLAELRDAPVPVEQRFRFAGPCHRSACQHWAASKCGLIDQIVEVVEEARGAPDAAELPRCSIRASCRWFEQRGATACAVCPLVVTDQSGHREVLPGP